MTNFADGNTVAVFPFVSNRKDFGGAYFTISMTLKQCFSTFFWGNRSFYASPALALLCNLAIAYVVYMVCRIVYVAVNWHILGENFPALGIGNLFSGSLLFDTSAILYTNALYALLMLLPLHYKESKTWQDWCHRLFVAVNGLAVVINLVDAVYFVYTGRRTTTTVFSEFRNEKNILPIVMQSVVSYWYLVVAAILIISAMSRLYVRPKTFDFHGRRSRYVKYYCVQLLCLVAFIPLCVAGMRGGFTTAVRPITLSNANKYVNRPVEAAIVLNTPFSLIRSTGKDVFYNPGYYTERELDAIYSPVHNAGKPMTNTLRRRKNVVVLIVESFGREYIGAYNEKLDGGHYKGYTPFVDKLLGRSLSFDYTFANGRKSIDGMPSILSGIPHFVEPFFLTPASLNEVSGLAGELGRCGYSSAFFHGAENGSMGFEAFARTTGFQQYYGRTEYNADSRFNGDKDFDGMWAIWDEPFLQYYALKMTEMKQPFITAVFTASSHHPYKIPEEYGPQFDIPAESGNPIHKCIRYTDMSLRKFFETAAKQPWYKNTIFVFTSDHTNINDHQEYATDLGLFGAPIFIFDPSGELPRKRSHTVAQQTDIMPTVLNYLGYGNPYVAFGKDLLDTPAADAWAVNYNNGIYQYVKGDYVIRFDGSNLKGAYNYKADWFMTKDLKDEPAHKARFRQMERELKGIIQSYMTRMTGNRLVVAPLEKK